MTHKIFFGCFLLFGLVNTRGYAQDYGRLRLALGGGQSSASGSVLFFVEPSVRLSHKITLGFRQELFIPSNARTATSTAVNAQYYLPSHKGKFLVLNHFRLFIGLGISGNNRSASLNPYTAYYPNGVSQNIYPEEINDRFVLGFFPRLGFDYKHLTFNLEYNFIQSLKVTLDHYDTQTAQFIGHSYQSVSTNYLGVKLGLFLGGGLKKKDEHPR